EISHCCRMKIGLADTAAPQQERGARSLASACSYVQNDYTLRTCMRRDRRMWRTDKEYAQRRDHPPGAEVIRPSLSLTFKCKWRNKGQPGDMRGWPMRTDQVLS